MKGSRFRRVIVNRPNLRIPFPDRFADRLRGATAVAVSRRGKYLIVELSSGETLIMHLGMSGWFHVAPIGDRSRDADPHDHVAFVMSSGQTVLFNDPRRFGFMDLAEEGRLRGVSLAERDGARAALGRIRRRCHSRAPAKARRCRSRSRSSINASSPASATSTRARRCITRGCRRSGRRRRSPRPRARRRRSATRAGGVDQGRADERDQAPRIAVSIRALQGLRT